MKKRIYLFISIVFCTSIAMNAQTGKSKITFEKIQHNYGTFKEEAGVQTVDFNFKNDGSTPLIINNVQASCGCTTPSWTREPVAPGAKGFIKVSYDPRNRPGVFNKTVNVSSNAENGNVILSILGEVTPKARTIEEDYPMEIGPLRAKTNHIAFQQLKTNQVKKDSVEIINNTSAPLKLSFKTPPPHLKAVIKPSQLGPKQKGYLVVTFDAPQVQAYGFVNYRVYLNIDGQDDFKNSVAVSATLEEDFSKLTPAELIAAPVASFDNESHDFGDMKPNTKVEHSFLLKNAGKNNLIIRHVQSSCGCTAVTPSKTMISANESVPIKVVFDSTGKTGRQNKTITVITNDPKNANKTLRIACNVLEQAQ
jgi:hypothetical protein